MALKLSSIVNFWQVSVDSVLRGRIHTMLTYSISNNRLDHLIEDMLGLYFFGGEVLMLLNTNLFFLEYMAAFEFCTRNTYIVLLDRSRVKV